jgi:hypothetical protein
MAKLGRAIATLIVDEHGTAGFLRRLADPFFFQALGCIIGFDWHSSGLTTTTCGALKEALGDAGLGLAACGGKGGTSRQAPGEIREFADTVSLPEAKAARLEQSSRLAAKVDSALVQDGYALYHHCFFLDEKGNWAVVQQGLHDGNGLARRYHWLSDTVTTFVEEPHNAVCCDDRTGQVLDLTAKEHREVRSASLDLVRDGALLGQRSLLDYTGESRQLIMPRRHALSLHHLPERSREWLRNAYELQPASYEELISLKGIGARTIRALALVSELCHGLPLSWRDPAKYSFAHGGKDGWPYPVDREGYDMTIRILQDAITEARLGEREKLGAIQRLHALAGPRRLYKQPATGFPRERG